MSYTTQPSYISAPQTIQQLSVPVSSSTHAAQVDTTTVIHAEVVGELPPPTLLS